ncbi:MULTISPECIES: hypothetical protein [unclassified Pseudomonas]|uniref:hypothetical protein n=1 Tax=unclassified Pseudomonas TaxID=196821 RepID=UPI001C4532F8|nr:MULTISPECIES: hypothetical protein [unclassified Pseudomonas]MBV7480064.1 hypothetical protein [Pseudomonas sp. PDM31]MDN4543307.1 hypothetical protein [Pseudomonas sp. C32]
MKHWLHIMVFSAVPFVYTAQAQDGFAYTPKGPIEAKYQAAGRWAVTKTTTTEPFDREGHLCDIFRPLSLGGSAGDVRHPVVAWANGTGQPARKYRYFLRHLASWGFIVVSSRDTDTADGASTTDAANYIIQQGRIAGSPFCGKVDEKKSEPQGIPKALDP